MGSNDDLSFYLEHAETENKWDSAHLSFDHKARTPLTTPLHLRELCEEGKILELNEDDIDSYYDDDCEETYDERTLELFQNSLFSEVEIEKGGHVKVTSAIDIKAVSNDSSVNEEWENLEDDTIRKLILRPGDGDIPKRCKLFCHYMLVVEGSDEPMDTTLNRKYPQVIDLRTEGTILPALETCLRSMKLREMAKFKVDSSKAYGALGCPPRVPPNSNMIFLLETLQYIDEDRLNTPHYMSSKERQELPFAQIREEVVKLKNEGNAHYSEKNFTYAVRFYRKSINIMEDYSVSEVEDENQRTEFLVKAYTNLAQAYLKLEKPGQACNACKAALRLKDDNDRQSAEVYYRFGLAKLLFKDVDAAKGLVEKAFKICPKNSKIRQLKREVEIENQRQKEVHKEMCKRIFQTGNADNSIVPKKFQSDEDYNE